jgi:hypothetical protein
VPDKTPDPGLNEFTRALAAVAPHPGQLDRDALIFAAGRAAEGRRGRIWKASTTLLTLVCTGLGATLAFRSPSVVEVQRVVIVSAPERKSPAPAPQDEIPLSPPAGGVQTDWSEGMRQRESILRGGVAALTSPPTVWPGLPERTPIERDVPEVAALKRFARE